MLFNSDIFLFAFLPIVFLTFRAFRSQRNRFWVLIAASYVFYAYWDWRFCFLLLLSSVISFAAGIGIGRATDPTWRRAWLITSVALDMTILGAFKYFDFFVSSIHLVLPGAAQPLLHVALPVGISFYTFHTISYVADVYSGRTHGTSDISEYLTYVSLFPQLVAGPITRYRQVACDLATLDQPARGAEIAQGVGFFVVGLIKKTVIADELARHVDPLLGDVGATATLTAWAIAVGFAFQIYFDFSGYSDMAVGLGRLFGVHIPQNFNAPYRAVGLGEFWRRWHMSLSSWLKDYLYIGLLGGNRLGRARTYLNIAVTMLLGGLWHGANWTFVVWGAYHGLLLIGERAYGMRIRAVPRALVGGLTFLFVVIGWVLFRSTDLRMAIAWFGRLLAIGGTSGTSAGPYLYLLLAAAGVIALLVPETWHWRFGATWRHAAVYAIGFVVAYVFMSSGPSPFLYYQF